jgi:hypothetical protein
MREIRTSGSEGGGIETNRFSLPLSLLRFSELSSNGNDLPTIIRSCRGGLDPGLRRGDD